MGIYLGQLPPAEIARLKAELAETLVANFCYPRFFDQRTQSLQMRPVDRAKRQEVWLYLSSVDFNAWSRVDLMSPDLQHQIERLFIQFVQRNRSFFGEQGRRRMSDIRMLIGTCASTVAQALRNHLTGQKQNSPPFGSPRPVLSWAAAPLSKRAEPTWEQIAPGTMLLQQQMQEWRGEVKPASDARVKTPVGASAPAQSSGTSSSGEMRRVTRPQAAPARSASSPAVTSTEAVLAALQQAAVAPPTVARATSAPAETRSAVASAAPIAPPVQVAPVAPVRPAEPLVPPGQAAPARPSGPLVSPVQAASARRTEPTAPLAPPVTARQAEPLAPAAGSASGAIRSVDGRGRTSPLGEASASATSATAPARPLAQAVQNGATSNTLTTSAQAREMLAVGEDDIAIFEQMRHQLLIWLRVEAITSGLEINGQGPTQLLDLLRQQGRLDETRLQVVSTLLNLANQVIKTGVVSVLDYKQALMFHLMHTKRA